MPKRVNNIFKTAITFRKLLEAKTIFCSKLYIRFLLAEVYHSENIEKVAEEFIEKAQIKNGDYDVTQNYEYRIPSFWELGRIYQRLIVKVSKKEEKYIDTLVEVLESWIIEKIDNYNSSMYYEGPEYMYACYEEGKVL